MFSVLGWGLGVAVSLYAAVCAALYFGQERLMYIPSQQLYATPANKGLAFEEVWLTTDDDVRIHGWWVPGPDAAANPTVLFLHGNGGNIGDRQETFALLHNLGLNTLMVDYRGYGRSEGSPGEAGTYRDAWAAWRHITEERGVAPADIIVHGRSLGGGPAAWLATQPGVAGKARSLVLESTFTSMPDVAADHYPGIPVRLLSRVRYPTRERLRSIEMPVMVIHSQGDRTVPYHHGQSLYDTAMTPKRFVMLNGDHNDGFLTSGKVYLDALRWARDPAP